MNLTDKLKLSLYKGNLENRRAPCADVRRRYSCARLLIDVEDRDRALAVVALLSMEGVGDPCAPH